jgi:hypothetical protein
MVEGQFSMPLYEKEYAAMTALLADLYKDCEKIVLNNDGDITKGEDVVTRVRTDYFIHYPMLQQLALSEIDKYERLKAAIAHIKAIRNEHEKYNQNIESFSHLLFYRLVDCLNGEGKIDCVKTNTVSFKYHNQYNEEHTFVLSRRGMKYDAYPLYQAFRSYCWLENLSEENPEGLELSSHTQKDLKNLRRDLDIQRIDYQKKNRVEGDYVIPAILKQLWSTANLYALEFEQLKGVSDEERDAIVRFYKSLRAQIDAEEDRSTCWPRSKSLDELSQMLGGVTFAWIWDNGKQLELYPAMYRNYAFDRSMNNWVPLNPNMFVAKNGQWVPISLDAQGNIIL